MGMDGLRWWVQLRGACASEEREDGGLAHVAGGGVAVADEGYLAGMMEACGGCDVGVPAEVCVCGRAS